MPKARDFVNRRDVKPQSANDADFEALFERHSVPRAVRSEDLPIARIRPNPFQARRSFAGIDELAEAMRVHGFTSRLRVRRDPSDATMFQLVYGERRLRAAEAAGLDTVPCDIADHGDDELLEIGLAENIQREDLDPLEEAEAFRAFMQQRGYTIVRLAERLGKDRGYVESRLALLRAPADVQQMVGRRRDTVRTAREIAKLPSAAARRPVIDGVLRGELSTGDVRAIVRDARAGDEPVAEQGVPHELDARTIDRDARRIAAIWSRWQAECAGLTAFERRRLRQHLAEQLEHIKRLLLALDEDE